MNKSKTSSHENKIINIKKSIPHKNKSDLKFFSKKQKYKSLFTNNNNKYAGIQANGKAELNQRK